MNSLSEFTLRDAIRAIFRHAGKAALVAFLLMAATTAATLLADAVYRSDGKLYVRLGRENVVLDPTATLGEDMVVSIPSSREAEINSVVEILRSRALAEKTVEALGPDVILGPQEDQKSDWKTRLKSELTRWGLRTEVGRFESAVNELLDGSEVKTAKRSNIVEVAFEGSTPEQCQTIVSTMIDEFLKEHIRLNRSPQAYSFLSGQAERHRQALHSAEDGLASWKETTGLISLEDQKRNLVDRLGRLEDDLLQAEADLAAKEAELRSFSDGLTELPEMEVTEERVGVADNGTDGMRQQLYSLRIREKQLEALYREGHPKLTEIRQQIEAAASVLREEENSRTEVVSGPNQQRREAQLAILMRQPDYESLRTKAEILRMQAKEARLDVIAAVADERKYQQLEREVALSESEYLKYVGALERVRIDNDLSDQKMSNIGIAQSATLMERPVRPRRLLNLAAGFFFAIIAGMGVAILCELSKSSIRTRQDFERQLHIPVLATIPDSQQGTRPEAREEVVR